MNGVPGVPERIFDVPEILMVSFDAVFCCIPSPLGERGWREERRAEIYSASLCFPGPVTSAHTDVVGEWFSWRCGFLPVLGPAEEGPWPAPASKAPTGSILGIWWWWFAGGRSPELTVMWAGLEGRLEGTGKLGCEREALFCWSSTIAQSLNRCELTAACAKPSLIPTSLHWPHCLAGLYSQRRKNNKGMAYRLFPFSASAALG